jgi:oligopeptide/dipeptide ABC transporter ATP-binding protein
MVEPGAISTDIALSIRDLTIGFGPGGSHHVVDEAGFDVRRGEIMGLVGESGSGKTLTALSVLGLLPPGGRVLGGTITFGGDNLLQLNDRQLSRIRGDKIAMIFQDPATSMNPLLRVGNQVAEPLVTHRGQSWQSARTSAVDLLRRVHIPAAADRARAYPFQYSGGMLQRATIAMALGCHPELIIADEPTTALDVTIQAQILELLRELSRTRSTTILLITHDLGVVAELCDRVAVMYRGRVMEVGAVDQIFARPLHPYTTALLEATPRIDEDFDIESVPPLQPRPRGVEPGCRFADRCPLRVAQCAVEPELRQVEVDRSARCWLADGVS